MNIGYRANSHGRRDYYRKDGKEPRKNEHSITQVPSVSRKSGIAVQNELAARPCCLANCNLTIRSITDVCLMYGPSGRQGGYRDMRTAPLFLLLVGLAGCAGYSFKCTDSIARSDCPPDSAAGREMEQQRKDAQMSAEIDHARCRSYASPGSQVYARCLDSLENERSKIPGERKP